MRIREMFRERSRITGIHRVNPRYQNISRIFKNTKCKNFKKEIGKGRKVLALKVRGFGGLFTKEKEPQASFAIWLCEEVKKINQKGYITTDELPAYGISKTEVRTLKQELGAGPSDLVIMAAGKEKETKEALNMVVNMINMLIT